VLDLLISGVVASGLGKGGYFISLAWVQARLTELMGERPFPGTLNLRITPEARDELFRHREQFAPVIAPDDAACPGYLAGIALKNSRGEQLQAWAILPESTVHADVLEIVSQYHLRERMALHDGDCVTVDISLSKDTSSNFL